MMDLRPAMMLSAVLFLQFDHFVEIPNEFLITIIEIGQIFDMRPKIPVRLSDGFVHNEAQQLAQHIIVEIHQFTIVDSIVQTNDKQMMKITREEKIVVLLRHQWRYPTDVRSCLSIDWFEMSHGVQLIDTKDPLSTIAEDGLSDERIGGFSPHGKAEIVSLSYEFGMSSIDNPRHHIREKIIVARIASGLQQLIHRIDREEIEVVSFAMPVA